MKAAPDKLKVAQRLSEQRPDHLAPLRLCIQVNADGGASKSGVPPEEAMALAQQVAVLPGLCLRGVMSIPEPAPDFESACASFMPVRAVFDALNQQGLALDTLSMGMSADMEAAIHCGSTLVRVGSAIFGGRTKPVLATCAASCVFTQSASSWGCSSLLGEFAVGRDGRAWVGLCLRGAPRVVC